MRITNFSTGRRQRGITLIEIMIGIAIALVIAAIAIGLAVAARRDALTQDMQNQVLRVAEVANSLARPGSYTGITEDELCLTGKLEGLCNNDGGEGWQLNNAAGGTFALAENNGGRALIITASDVPVSSCVTLSGNLFNNFAEIRVGGTKLDNTAQSITGGCSFSGSDEGSVEFYLGRPAVG